MRIKLRVHVLNMFDDLGLDLGLGRPTDALLRVLSEDDERERLRETGAAHARLLDERVGKELGFDRCWGDIFTLARLEDLFDAAGDAQAPLGVDLTAIARLKEAILGEDLFGGLFVLIITHHRGRALDLDLADIADAGRDALLILTDITDAHIADLVGMGI